MADERLEMRFHGRILDHLGIQMYQSPVAALAELIANAWDADTPTVRVSLPTSKIDSNSTIVVADKGSGMTLNECQDRYLNVGYNRRASDPTLRTPGGRRILGRKGIGKFAGFGIADVVEIDTTSSATGERTKFRLELAKLRGDGIDAKYVDTKAFEIPILKREGPKDSRRAAHGTTVTLRALKMGKRPALLQFRRSMARRFLLRELSDEFSIIVNGQNLPKENEGSVQFRFPEDFPEGKYSGTLGEEGFGTDLVDPEGHAIRWRAVTYQEPISDEELSGFVVYISTKLAQTPFFFNLEGGLHGQHGQEYLSGVIEADYLDEMPIDVIATERQRINWDDPAARHLLAWGQATVKKILGVWADKRSEAKTKMIDEKLAPFSTRLDKYPLHERMTVERALKSMARVPSLSNEQFEGVCDSVLLAFEKGRLQHLFEAMAQLETASETEVLQVLLEANVLTALHTAEAVSAKLLVIRGLQDRISHQDLEGALRDYVMDNPWLLSPKWETFKKETRVTNILKSAAKEAKFVDDEDWKGRVDLVLSSGHELLVVEFMRPGVNVDWDHIQRFEKYVLFVRSELRGQTNLNLERVSGLLVADNVSRKQAFIDKLMSLQRDEMNATDWDTLLSSATAQWGDFLEILASRAPEEERLAALAAGQGMDSGLPTGGSDSDGADA